MKTGRNDPCPCGSGRKYKKCCEVVQSEPVPASRPSPRFRFEHGSYGGPGRQYMPSAICHEQTAPGNWREHFCLVNPTALFDGEDEAATRAEADLNAAAGGTDAAFALSLKEKGYVQLDDFRYARD
jgi:hypothetical protein